MLSAPLTVASRDLSPGLAPDRIVPEALSPGPHEPAPKPAMDVELVSQAMMRSII